MKNTDKENTDDILNMSLHDILVNIIYSMYEENAKKGDTGTLIIGNEHYGISVTVELKEDTTDFGGKDV